jgi:hypothetical protein
MARAVRKTETAAGVRRKAPRANREGSPSGLLFLSGAPLADTLEWSTRNLFSHRLRRRSLITPEWKFLPDPAPAVLDRLERAIGPAPFTACRAFAARR